MPKNDQAIYFLNNHPVKEDAAVSEQIVWITFETMENFMADVLKGWVSLKMRPASVPTCSSLPTSGVLIRTALGG